VFLATDALTAPVGRLPMHRDRLRLLGEVTFAFWATLGREFEQCSLTGPRCTFGSSPATSQQRLTGWELVAALVVMAAAEIAALSISGTAAVPIIAPRQYTPGALVRTLRHNRAPADIKRLTTRSE
jgi:hypothetical protein